MKDSHIAKFTVAAGKVRRDYRLQMAVSKIDRNYLDIKLYICSSSSSSFSNLLTTFRHRYHEKGHLEGIR